MKITALVENTSNCELKARHGLSLYIKTDKHRILFDVGSGCTLFDNARKRNIDLSGIDTVIISHGHVDHGGALSAFLKINTNAKVYIQKKAFEPHYSRVLWGKVQVGLDKNLETHPQIILLDGDYRIDEELSLFTVSSTDKCHSSVNDVLYGPNGRDDFSHEQNLIISENQTALIMGCGHSGVVNIMEKARSYQPQICVGGFHLFNPIMKKTVSLTLLDEIADELQAYRHIRFYTCHCTGTKAFKYLSRQLPNLFYLSCGESITL